MVLLDLVVAKNVFNSEPKNDKPVFFILSDNKNVAFFVYNFCDKPFINSSNLHP